MIAIVVVVTVAFSSFFEFNPDSFGTVLYNDEINSILD